VKGKMQTLEALQVLTQAAITPDNWKLFAAQLDILDVPGKQDIVKEWEAKFTAPVPDPAASAAGSAGISGGDPMTSGLPSLPGGIPMNI
jgi:hypothetical protein